MSTPPDLLRSVGEVAASVVRYLTEAHGQFPDHHYSPADEWLVGHEMTVVGNRLKARSTERRLSGVWVSCPVSDCVAGRVPYSDGPEGATKRCDKCNGTTSVRVEEAHDEETIKEGRASC